MKPVHVIALLSLCLFGVACTPLRLKAPASVSQSTELKIEGYKQGSFSFKDKDLRIGSYQVTNIDRDWDEGSQTSVGPWQRDSSKKAYRFDVIAQGRTLHAECGERATQNQVAGWGTSKVTLQCTCGEGSNEHAKVELVNGTGNAQIQGVPYDLASLHLAENGAHVNAPLGYEFRGAQGSGAIDVSVNGRAWLPSNASEDQSLALVCSYAGFLLYRPTSTM